MDSGAGRLLFAAEDTFPAMGATEKRTVQLALERTALFFESTRFPPFLALDATARRAPKFDKGLAAILAFGT